MSGRIGEPQCHVTRIALPEGETSSTAVREIVPRVIWALVDAGCGRARAERYPEVALQAFEHAIAPLAVNAQVSDQALRAAIVTANGAILEEDHEPRPGDQEFACSLVALALDERDVVTAHIGNARCYRFRSGARTLLTRPHTALSELGATDHQSAFAVHHRHLLTRALGLGPRVAPEIARHAARPGDLYVLVNDDLAWAVEHRDVAELFVHQASSAAVASTIGALAGDREAGRGAVVAIALSDLPD